MPLQRWRLKRPELLVILALIATVALRRQVGDPQWRGLIADVGLVMIAGLLLQKRRQAEALQRQASLNWRRMLQNIPQMVWSARGENYFYNDRWAEFTGVDIADGFRPESLIHRDDREEVVTAFEDCLRTGTPFEREYRLRHRSGQYRWVLARAVPAVDDGRAAIGWFGTCTDVHDRVVAEHAVQDSENRLLRILNSVPQVIWAAGPDGRVKFVSDQWTHVLGGDVQQLLGEGWIGLVHPDDAKGAVDRWTVAQKELNRYESEFRIRCGDGNYRWVMVSAQPELGGDGAVVGWFGACKDIHERVLATQALKDSEQLHRSILEASADCIMILSPTGQVQMMNRPGLAAMEIETFDEVREKPWASLWPKVGSASAADAVARARQGETVRFTGFCPTARKTPKWWDVVVTPMMDSEDRLKGVLCLARDISVSRAHSEQLRWASEHDALTGLPNRRAFQGRLQSATERSTEQGTSLGLLLIDLDHFKHVNDSLGHSAGDELLQSVGERLRNSVRHGDFVARIGGDEFAIILEGIESDAQLISVGDSVLEQIQRPARIAGRTMSGAASIGGAIFPAHGATADDLIKSADTALYALKSAGRGGTKLFHAYMHDEAQKAASELGVARTAVSERSVVPYYQSQVDLRTGRISGFEALLRWKQDGRVQLPETLAEAFKDYELAAKIGDLMQRKVARDIAGWSKRGLAIGRVSINAAPAEFLRDDYAQRLLAILAEFGVPGELIEVEVTEHVFMDRCSEYVARALRALKQAGVRIALDDFGTGYSSLSHLRDFTVDVVKIDQSFVRDMTANGEIRSIVAAVVSLAKSLNLSIVAEGVETRRQSDMLKSIGCDLAQGHLFGTAIEGARVPALIGHRRIAA